MDTNAPRPQALNFRSQELDARVSELLAQMTLQEKIGQLVQVPGGENTGPEVLREFSSETCSGFGSMLNFTGAAQTNALQQKALSESRLKIPILFALDVIHGYRTVYPVPLGMSCSWDVDLAERCARMAAVEATSEGIRWTFSPMVDVGRDARWGRITEGNGEDPMLGAALAKAWVKGYQGENLSDPTSMAACAKHMAGYGFVEGGREYFSVDVSDRVLRDVILPPFQACSDAGAATFMSAFNTMQGVPASASSKLLDEILRNEWGFEGLVVSDWASVEELIHHGIANTGDEAARKAILSGVDMDMSSNLYATTMLQLVEQGKVSMERIDEAVARALRVKFALGLFENPITDEARFAEVTLVQSHLELAREAAEKSFVLLKNDSILPLASDAKLALIGPLADSQLDMLGAWNMRGQKEDVVTLLASLRETLGDGLAYAKGCEIHGEDRSGFSEALAAAAQADVILFAFGESASMTGEARARTTLDAPGVQSELLRELVKLGKPVVGLVFSGRPLDLSWESQHLTAILQAWFPGVQAGPALVRTLYGDSNPSGKLTASFPRSVGQMPLYYNMFNTGRPPRGRKPGEGDIAGYVDMPFTALYPFGFGLSYTQFEYSHTTVSDVTVSLPDLLAGKTVEATATVANVGSVAGDEIVQLYIRLRGTSVSRPTRELKGFQRVSLEPGQSRLVSFELNRESLSFWNLDMSFLPEACEVAVWIGGDSTSGTEAAFQIVSQPTV